MAKQHIDVTQEFKAPVSTIFAELTDHVKFGKLLRAKITRIVDAPGDNPNGLGSVRKISPAPLAEFEETVVTFKPDELMEYRVSKGSPIKNHIGRMEFSAINAEDGRESTRLRYTIVFEPKLPVPFLGDLLKKAIEMPVKKGLAGLAERYAK
ncbi:SRPBCC family protein [Alkalimarinus sediminis]|uniref:SRPBCC family protein n=1 Tax=Alkalimarinus sediminis TaxID=1632866 RepID=A0A9E8HF91_9ALTE|nr:SRPBCC family protein [Alkalimarinus sediminis]UZW73560.1 SRPBCC family protein [Alkalimarinus sediminis]